jgi:hypothetical protein
MYKKYKVFVHLTVEHIKQLQAAGIEIDSHIELESIDIRTISGKVPITALPIYSTFVYVRTAQQETLFNLLFTEESYRLEEWCSNEYIEYAKFG